MEKEKLELAEREFALFESKIRELKTLKRALDSLNTKGFESHVSIIEGKFSDVDNILRIQKLINILKLKTEKRELSYRSKLTQLIEQIFECDSNITVWSNRKLGKEYLSIYNKYNLLPKKEKAAVYSTITKLYKRIQQK